MIDINLNKLKKLNSDIYLAVRKETIESFGYLSELKRTIEDYISFYTN